MRKLEANGIQLHYHLSGEGDALTVFIHGLTIDDLSSWYFTLAPDVTKRSTVLLYDLRGHGRSESPASGYRIADMVADLHALIHALDLEGRPLHLVANSFGGVVATAFAHAYPDAVTSLVLLDAHLPNADCMQLMCTSLALSDEERSERFREGFKNWPGKNNPLKIKKLKQKAGMLLEGTSLLNDLKAGPILSDSEFSKLQMPVLAVYGEHSDILEQGRKLSGLLPNCRFVILAGSSHSIVWEETASLARMLDEWLSGFE